MKQILLFSLLCLGTLSFAQKKEYDKKLNDNIQKEMALRREVTYEETSKDYKSYKRRMELLKLMTEQKEVNKNEL